MAQELITLEPQDLPWALGIMGLAIALSLWQRLALEWQLILATGRSLLQLIVVGYIIAAIFDLNHPIPVLLILGVMLTIAAIVAGNRISKRINGLFTLVWVSMFVSTALTLSYVLMLIIQPETWYSPQYLIPLTGMVLGNSMNAAALAGERLASLIKHNRLEVETHLCLGATPEEAISVYRKEAIRISLIPTLNQMMVVGIVSLPGMFTGQVLAGMNPLNAASYQILILFMIAFSNLLTAFLVSEGVYRRFFTPSFSLKLD
jgi:putative ABC transport system permease protein